MRIEKLPSHRLDEARALVWRVFLQFEAPQYRAEGVEHFRRFLHDPQALAALTVYGAFEGAALRGVLATRMGGSHIALFFVDPAHHRQGIGRRLFEEALRHCPGEGMTVNSSPYAVEVYRRLGFVPTDAEREQDGIRFTPMALRT